MSAADEVVRVALLWSQKATNDLQAAVQILKLGENCPTDTACFHAQQSVEKNLKALLVLHAMDFPRTHHISSLLQLLPEPLRPDLTPDEQERLSDYAVSARYPGDYDPITLAEARRAVRIARRVSKQIRAHLPKAKRRTR